MIATHVWHTSAAASMTARRDTRIDL